MRKVLITALLCLPVPAVSQTIPSCERLISEMQVLSISEGELAELFHDQKAQAERCNFDDSLACEGLTIGPLNLGSWRSVDGSIVANDVVWPEGRVSSVEITGSEWVLEGIEFDGVSIERMIRSSSECRRTGLAFGRVKIEALDSQGNADSVRVGSLPAFSIGVLPPRFRVAQNDVEGSMYGSLLEFGEDEHAGVIGVAANFASGGWFGGGVTFSSIDLNQDLHGFTLELNVDETVKVAALGTLALHGSDANRAGGTFEMAPTEIWSLRRLENNSWRGTQSSAAGISLRGPAHELTLGTRIWGHSDLTDVSLRFGASLGTGRWKTHLDLDHLSTRTTTEVKLAHSSTMGIRVEHHLLQRATSLVPFVDILANFGVIPTAVGFEASTSAALMPGADLSTTVIGAFESGRHVLRPRVFGSGEVYGFTQRGILSADEPPFPFTRRPGLYHAWAGLDQEWQGAFSLRLPVGLHIQGDTSEELRVLPVAELGLDIQSFRVGGAVRCKTDCSGAEWRSFIGVENSSASMEIGAQDHASWWAPTPGSGPQQRWSNLHQIDLELGLLSYVAASARLGRTFSTLRVLTDFDDVGISAGSRWSFSELGWAWGADAALTPDGEWLGLLGLQMAR